MQDACGLHKGHGARRAAGKWMKEWLLISPRSLPYTPFERIDARSLSLAAGSWRERALSRTAWRVGQPLYEYDKKDIYNCGPSSREPP